MAHHIISGRNFLRKQIKRDKYSIIILDRRIKVNPPPTDFLRKHRREVFSAIDYYF